MIALKRTFDIVVAAAALVLLSPLLMVVAVLVRIRLGAPVLFRQPRPGLHSRTFTLLKFRTMLDALDEKGEPLPDGVRLTAFGRKLRSTSLDELPELVNVLKGEMSLVGPRPLRRRYLPLYSAEQARRHDVRPGITGWSQINGRNALTWTERLALDVWYVDHWSFLLDLRILFKTVAIVFSRKDVLVGGQDDFESFNGSN